jgi:hypothetical protein
MQLCNNCTGPGTSDFTLARFFFPFAPAAAAAGTATSAELESVLAAVDPASVGTSGLINAARAAARCDSKRSTCTSRNSSSASGSAISCARGRVMRENHALPSVMGPLQQHAKMPVSRTIGFESQNFGQVVLRHFKVFDAPMRDRTTQQ